VPVLKDRQIGDTFGPLNRRLIIRSAGGVDFIASMKRPRLQAVQARPGFILILTFVDGQIFHLDMTQDLANYPGLKPLQGRKAFAGARLGDDGWTVEWPQLDIQIGADTLYLGLSPSKLFVH